MAEFCPDCWDKLNDTKNSRWKFALSWDKDLCEECGQYKHVIVRERLWARIWRVSTEIIEDLKRQ